MQEGNQSAKAARDEAEAKLKKAQQAAEDALQTANSQAAKQQQELQAARDAAAKAQAQADAARAAESAAKAQAQVGHLSMDPGSTIQAVQCLLHMPQVEFAVETTARGPELGAKLGHV